MTAQTYEERMLQSRQFKYFGIKPLWRPGEGDIEGFCHDEVVRQFHDTRVKKDGGVRIEWMLDAWAYAQTHVLNTPTIYDVLALGNKVEPHENRIDRFRSHNIIVGDRYGAPPPYIRELVTALCEKAGDVVLGVSDSALPYQLFTEGFKQQLDEGLVSTIDDWYLAFEWIHPFYDGNGRSGKILHNWLQGTLDEPELVADYFGGGNP